MHLYLRSGGWNTPNSVYPVKTKTLGISHKNENDGSKVERRKDTQEKEKQKLQNDKSNKKAREKGATRL